jgi:RHS repeat-associated protein
MSKRYLYGEAVDQLFAQEDLSKTLGDTARNLWPLVDHLGTVRDLAKQDGTIAVHYTYDSYGNVKSGDASKTRYLFTSREFDTATKLQYNRARYYDAAAGRWISEDPLGFGAGDANVSRYVGNRSPGATDPSGLASPSPGYGCIPNPKFGSPRWDLPPKPTVVSSEPWKPLTEEPASADFLGISPFGIQVWGRHVELSDGRVIWQTKITRAVLMDSGWVVDNPNYGTGGIRVPPANPHPPEPRDPWVPNPIKDGPVRWRGPRNIPY